MDREMITGMLFVIVLVAMTGGFVLLIPISRQLARFLEFRMTAKSRVEDQEKTDMLLRAVESLRDDVTRLAERQDFTEKLLERPRGETGERRE